MKNVLSSLVIFGDEVYTPDVAVIDDGVDIDAVLFPVAPDKRIKVMEKVLYNDSPID